MDNQEIYRYLNDVGYMSFSTIDGDEVQSRIAYFYAADEEGFYFKTMSNKPFARQLHKHPKLTVCGLKPTTKVMEPDELGQPTLEGGYSIRLTGDVKLIEEEEIEEKVQENIEFVASIIDHENYPATQDFCLYRGKGEIFDYDYEKSGRANKLERMRFTFGEGYDVKKAGCQITNRCVACNRCKDTCTYSAITPGTPYKIDAKRCDECGSCMLVCPVKAIEAGEGF